MAKRNTDDTTEVAPEMEKPLEVDGYAKRNADAKEFLSHYGADDIEQFIGRIGSDAVYARRVVEDFIASSVGGEKSAPLTATGTSGAPQEKNITGKLEHKTDVPTVVKGAASEIPPPAAV